MGQLEINSIEKGYTHTVTSMELDTADGPPHMKKVLNDDWRVTSSPASCSERFTRSAFLPTCEDGEDGNNGE